MKTSRIILFAALGAAVALLFTDEGKELRKNAAEGVGKLKDKLGDLTESTSNKLSDLTKIMSKQVKGLSNDTRKRLQDVISESTNTAKSLKRKARRTLS